MLAAALLLLGGCADSPPQIEVRDAWARATAAGQSSAAVYATIVNEGGGDRLTGVSSTAGMAMLHDNDSTGGMARMRMVGEVAVPEGGRLTLAPGGLHVMLSGLKAPLIAGSRVPLTFRFAGSGERKVEVAVVAPGSR
jgi:copper(I)-binding protein